MGKDVFEENLSKKKAKISKYISTEPIRKKNNKMYAFFSLAAISNDTYSHIHLVLDLTHGICLQC